MGGNEDVRSLIHASLGLMILTAPVAAAAQSEMPPPIVQSLAGVEVAPTYSPWLGAVAGTAVAIVGVNAWTGGALLAPTVGPALSAVLGGAWLGTAAVPPLSAQALFETTTLVASGVSGALIGYWIGNR